MRKLIDGDSLVVNSLNFEKGSEQPNHFDTYDMPPPEGDELAVTSVLLEDVGLDAGPVCVYLGIHFISPYRFSHEGIHVGDKANEMPTAKAYIDEELEKRKIKPAIITGEMGDVLIWHAQAYHGGIKSNDSSLTRKSLVTHY